jgi:hypothetical protein
MNSPEAWSTILLKSHVLSSPTKVWRDMLFVWIISNVKRTPGPSTSRRPLRERSAPLGMTEPKRLQPPVPLRVLIE